MDNFNHIIYDLEGVEVKIKDVDQPLILLCFVTNSDENIVIPFRMIEQQLLSMI